MGFCFGGLQLPQYGLQDQHKLLPPFFIKLQYWILLLTMLHKYLQLKLVHP